MNQLFSIAALQQQLRAAKNLTRKQMDELILSLLELREQLLGQREQTDKNSYIWALDAAIASLRQQIEAAQYSQDILIQSLRKYEDKELATYIAWKDMVPSKFAVSAWRELMTITDTAYHLSNINPTQEKLKDYANLLIKYLRNHVFATYKENPSVIFRETLASLDAGCDKQIEVLTEGKEHEQSEKLASYYNSLKKIINDNKIDDTVSRITGSLTGK